MNRILRNFLVACAVVLCVCLHMSSVSAAQETDRVQQVDSEVVKVRHSDYHEGARYGLEGADYIFTGKSGEKMIPLQIDTDGVLFYCFSSEDMKLLDGEKHVIHPKEGDEFLSDLTVDKTIAEKAVSVKKSKKYYIQLPKMAADEKLGIYIMLFPKVKEIFPKVKGIETEEGKEYISEGTGKYVYYSFTIDKNSMVAVYVDHLYRFRRHSKNTGDMQFKIQKQIKGTWRDITSVRKKEDYVSRLAEATPYGLSKGKYRLGIKMKKTQSACIYLRTRSMKFKKATKKSGAVGLKKKREKEGMLVWGDKKAHWYTVVKTKKNRVKTITMSAGGVIDKTDFTIYKKGTSRPVKKISIRGKMPMDDFVKYVSKTYKLNDNGIYYIKVSKADKKTNGAYKIGVK